MDEGGNNDQELSGIDPHVAVISATFVEIKNLFCDRKRFLIIFRKILTINQK